MCYLQVSLIYPSILWTFFSFQMTQAYLFEPWYINITLETDVIILLTSINTQKTY